MQRRDVLPFMHELLARVLLEPRRVHVMRAPKLTTVIAILFVSSLACAAPNTTLPVTPAAVEPAPVAVVAPAPVEPAVATTAKTTTAKKATTTTTKTSSSKKSTTTYSTILCNDGTRSPSCTSCSRGCCSHHGGCR